MMRCKYRISYTINGCNRAAGKGGFCGLHADVRCVSCNRQALRSCEERLPNTVCHRPLCSRCVHAGDDHVGLPDNPTSEGMARDLARDVLGLEAPTSTRTVVDDLTHLLEELSNGSR